MLSTSQKAHLLSKAGVPVLPFPARRLPIQERFLQKGVYVPPEELQADEEQRVAVARWAAEVDNLYATYCLERAARSLREAHEAELLGRLGPEQAMGSKRLGSG